MFVNTKELVPVHNPEGGPETIYILGEMDFRTRAAVSDSLLKLKLEQPGENGEAPESVEASYNNDQYNLALLVHNIRKWEGGVFDKVPCNRKTIAQLSPREPLVQATLQEINRRNRTRTEPLQARDETDADPKGESI